MKRKILTGIFAVLLLVIYFFYLSPNKKCRLANKCVIEANETGRGDIMKNNSQNNTVQKVRKQAVAGAFYTASKTNLLNQIDGFIANVEEEKIDGEILALVSPHAGYVYSGQIAAYGYKLIQGIDYDTVIIIGPNHRVRGFSGTSVYKEGYFETPLGKVPVDSEFTEKMIKYEPRLISDEIAHEYEHSLEVQIHCCQM